MNATVFLKISIIFVYYIIYCFAVMLNCTRLTIMFSERRLTLILYSYVVLSNLITFFINWLT